MADIDHRRFLRSLGDEERLRLNATSDAAGLAQLALHAGALAATSAAILAGVPGWPALIVVQGVLLVFLFCALHETAHRTAFRTPALNVVVGWVCGALVLMPPVWFRLFHFAHHRHTQDPERDPELAAPKPATWAAYALHVSGLPTWRRSLAILRRNARGGCDDAFVPAGKRAAVRREARVLVGLYLGVTTGAVLVGTWAPLYLWALPLLAGQPFLRLFLLAEHGRCAQVADMFANTRTTLTGGLVRRLSWNMPFHAEHHAMPTVPFHRLPDLHRHARPHLRETEDGYARFHARHAPRFTA